MRQYNGVNYDIQCIRICNFIFICIFLLYVFFLKHEIINSYLFYNVLYSSALQSLEYLQTLIEYFNHYTDIRHL